LRRSIGLPGSPDASVILITERARIDAIRDLIVAANTAQVEDPAFAAELTDWIRFSTAQAVTTRDGLYAASSGNPTPSRLARAAGLPLVFTAEAENGKVVAQVNSSPGLAIFVAERNDPAHWVAAGRSYQRFALAGDAARAETRLPQPARRGRLDASRAAGAARTRRPPARPRAALRLRAADAPLAAATRELRARLIFKAVARLILRVPRRGRSRGIIPGLESARVQPGASE
jgi:hypothetical protein